MSDEDVPSSYGDVLNFPMGCSNVITLKHLKTIVSVGYSSRLAIYMKVGHVQSDDLVHKYRSSIF